MADSKGIQKRIADAKLAIKSSDDKLKRLRDQLRAYSTAKKLSPAQVKAAETLNKQIKDLETTKNKASAEINKYDKIIGDLKKIESLDDRLKSEIDAYSRALALGGKPTKSKINALLSERKTYEKTLGSFAPKAPSIPSVTTADTGGAPTGTATPMRYTGAGTKASPLLLDGKAFSGTYKGKTYKNGIVVTATAKDGDGDKGAAGDGDKYAGTGTFDNPLTLGGKRFSGTYEGQNYENGILLQEKTGADTNAYQGAGTEEAPFLQNGKPYTGTYQGKTYKDGILVIAAPDTPETPVKKTLAELLKQTEFWYDLPDYIFSLDTELGDLLVKAVNEKWEPEKFESALKLTKWVQKNSANLRKRIIARAKHNELRAAGEDVSKTEYAQDTASLRRSVQDRARRIGSVLTDEQLDQVVGKIYDGFLDNDSVAIDRFIAPYIGKITSIVGTGLGTGGGQATYTGEALSNYQELQRIAKANGLKLEDILPKLSVPQGSTLENVVLQKLALGEIDPNAIAQTARQFAAQGQPEYVRGLLNQGYDLEQVYAPYRNIMASTLELDTNQIDLNDPTLRGAITNEGDMNIYDFKKLLRKDSRWDTTENARQDVSTAVYSILRDFGFQG